MPAHYAFKFHALDRDDGKAPSRVQIMRDGNLGWLGFEEMELDAKSAQNVINNFDLAGVDLPIDYHHSTKKQEEGKTEKAPAAGWIKAGTLEYVPGDGLYAEVTWNPEATKEIEAEEFKYLSPVVLSNEQDEIMLLHSVALTNRPRTKDQIELLKAAELMTAAGIGDITVPTPTKPKLVAAQDTVEEVPEFPAVDETQKLLGDLIVAMQEKGVTLADDAPLAEVLMAALEAVKGAEPAKESEEAPTEEVAAEAAKAAALAATPTAGVPTEAVPCTCKAAESTEMAALRVKAAKLDEVSDRLKVLEDERHASRVDQLVEAEIVRGTILPANTKMVAAARDLADKDEARFKTVFAAMDPVVEPGRVVGPAAGDPKVSGKTDRAKLIAASAERFNKDDEQRFGAKLQYYVAGDLEDAGESDLTDGEIEQLAKVGA